MVLKRIFRKISSDRIDLHIHSIHSDGLLNVQQIVNHAAKKKLKAISITDHDNISGLAEAESLCFKNGIEFINGIELSVRAKTCDLHMLGYYFDRDDKNLIEYIDFFKNERNKRAREIVRRLNDIGFKISFQSVEKISANGSIGRPHIAHVLIEAGMATSYQEVFQNYIGEGCKCFVPKFKIQPKEAISLIQETGGLCVLAHPGNDIADTELVELINDGIDGIETIHPKHKQEQVDHLRKISQKYKLIETGGADCHGQEVDNIFIGRLNIPYEFVKKMKNRLAAKKFVRP